LNVKKTPAQIAAAVRRTRAAKAKTAIATRRQVAIAKGIPTTVMHIHFRTIARVCQEWIKPFQAAVGMVGLLMVRSALR
jgi:hypothetical protein